jgi:hypothetical protein
MIDLNDFIAGGYLLTKYGERQPGRNADLLPERLVSLSDCIAPILQVYWGWNLDQYRQAALDFGIPADKLPVMQQWSIRPELGHPDIFYSLDAGRRCAHDLSLSQVLLLGIALPHESVDTFLDENRLYKSDYVEGEFLNERELLPKEWWGIQRALYQHQPLPASGEILGFEIASYYMNLGHSWLCSGLERDMHEQFGIRPNAHGLIDTYEDAKKVYDWIAEDEQQGHRAEPEPYYPWLIVSYPLTGASDTHAP